MSLNFSFSPEQKAVRDTVIRLCREELAPLVEAAEENEHFPKHVFKRWGELGLLGVRYPVADGGSGMDKVSGFALSEPDGGSNIRAMKTKADKVAGGWELSGSKLYITNAPIADFLMVAARTSPELKPDAISLFIVELPHKGFDIHKLRKEGIRGSETALIHIDSAFVPDDCLLGEHTGTYPLILECLSENRVGVAANALGMARAAFDASRAYADDRLVAGKRIGDYQAVAHKLAEMAADIEAARWMVYYGAWLVDQNQLGTATAAKVKLVATDRPESQ